MRKILNHHYNCLVIIAAAAVIALVALMTSCVPGATSAPTATGASGFPYISSIAAQVVTGGTASPAGTPTGSPAAMPTAATTPAGSNVMISVEVANFNVVNKLSQPSVPGEGHLHFFLDAVPPTQPGVPAVSAPGTYVAVPDTSYTWPDVKPGLHVLSAELANNDHTPLSTPAVASVMVMVPGVDMATMPQIMEISAQIMAPVASPASPAGTAAPSAGAVDIMVSIKFANFNVVAKEGEAAVPGEGHIHYFLDSIPDTFPFQIAAPSGGIWVHTEDTSWTFSNVNPGVHLVTAELVNNDHTNLNPPVVASILIIVMPPGMPPSPTATASPAGTLVPTVTAAPTMTVSPTAVPTSTSGY